MRTGLDRFERDGISAQMRRFGRLSPGPGRSKDLVESHQRERLRWAMVDIVAEEGYAAVTVRRLAKLAGVSTRTFYSQFRGKEECLLSIYGSAMDRAARDVAASRAAQLDAPQQLALSLQALLAGWAANPKLTRLALIDVYAGGAAVLEQVKARETQLELAVHHSLDRRELRASRPVATLITAGALKVGRSYLNDGREAELPVAVDELARWGRAYADGAAPGNPASDQVRPRSETRQGPTPDQACIGDPGEHGERELLLTAAMKQAAAEGYSRLSVPRICEFAGLSRSSFKRHFDDVEDCYLGAVEALAARYFHPLNARRWTPDWPGRVYLETMRLCSRLAASPGFARLVFVETPAAGLAGLRSRDEIIGRLADRWQTGAAGTSPPTPLVADATVAAVWATIARRLERGAAAELPEAAPDIAFALLAPVIGPADAAKTVGRDLRNSAGVAGPLAHGAV